MTAAALRRPAVRGGGRVRGIDLLRLALRQHRMLIIDTVLVCAALAVYLLTWHGSRVDLLGLANMEELIRYDVIGLSVVFAVFWGAPLLSREYEQRTHVLVWSQDVSRTRWLLTKLALLVPIVVVLTVGVELVNEIVYTYTHQVILSGGGALTYAFLLGFEGNILVQVGYALAAFAIGLVIGGLTRIPVVAMVASGLVFVVIRMTIADWLRALYLPTIQADSFTGVDDQSNAAQSVLHTGRVIEFAIYLVIAALCLAFAWFGVRRRQRV